MADGLTGLPIAAEMLDAANASGLDLRAALSGDDDHLRATEIAQPALLFVECALRSTLPADLDVVAVAGHSVGEYAAAVAANALQPADAMRAVIERGRAMAAMHEGTMCALIGIDVDAATAVCDETQRESPITTRLVNWSSAARSRASTRPRSSHSHAVRVARFRSM